MKCPECNEETVPYDIEIGGSIYNGLLCNKCRIVYVLFSPNPEPPNHDTQPDAAWGSSETDEAGEA